MIDRLILGVACCWLGLSGLLPATELPPQPLTLKELKLKAKQKQISNICDRKKKSPKVKEMCKKWNYS